MTMWASVTGTSLNSTFRKIALLVGHPCRLERLRDARLKDTNRQTRVPKVIGRGPYVCTD